MKLLSSITLIASILLSFLVNGQGKDGMNYQAVIRNADGTLKKNENVEMRFRIENSVGVSLYEETSGLTTDEFGSISHVVGNGTRVSGDYNTVDWSTTLNRWLEVDLQQNGSFVNISRDRLNSVPYALYAKEAGSVSNPTWRDASSNGIYYSSGNVGIGTNNPLSPLEVRVDNNNNNPVSNSLLVRQRGGGSSDDATILVQTDGATKGDPKMIFNINGSGGWSMGVDNSSDDRFKITPSFSNLSLTTSFTINTNGNVGIKGVTNPSEALEVGGNADVNGGITLNADLVSSGGDLITATGNGVINAGGGAMSSTLNVIADVFNGASRVSGDEELYIQGSLEIGGVAYKPGGGSWTTTSDRRLKKDIRDYKDGLTELLQINPVYFKYNDARLTQDLNKEYIGVIAQEMLQIAPYTVEEGDFFQETAEDSLGNTVITKQGEKYYAFDPSALTFMTINAVKEQQQTIESLREEVQKKDAQLNEMRARLTAIEAALKIDSQGESTK